MMYCTGDFETFSIQEKEAIVLKIEKINGLH